MRYFILTLIFLSAAAEASSIRDGSLQAKSDGNNVTVQWGTGDESQILGFEVERRNGTSGEFVTIADVQKKGSNSFYEYIDKSAFKTTGTIYQYRIKVVLKNGGVEHSTIITVSHNVSNVKRTWGSLKAMFR
jgi:lipopolysaccharide export LptBFGC system permease protein LptF